MKTFTSRSSQLCTVCSLLIAAAPIVSAADLVLQKVPPLTVEQAPAYPENVARQHLGAKLETAPGDSDNKAMAALLSGDPTASVRLPSGTTTFLVSLAKIENVDSLAFVNAGAKGQVTIATSNAKLHADSPQWKTAAQQELSSDTVKAKIGPSEAKYVRLTFNVTEPGQIAGFGVYSTPQVSDFTAPRTRPNTQQAKLSDIHAKARALYVSSGSDVRQANNMIDDQTTTSYTFAAQDGTPTTVIDLGKSSMLSRISAIYSPGAGNIEFYVLPSMPAGNVDSTVHVSAPGADGASPTPDAAPKTVRLDDAAFAGLKPVGSATDGGSEGRASVDFAPTTGRYVMVRWLPAAQQDRSFTLAEVAAFGQAGALLAANTSAAANEDETGTQGASDGKTMLDGKTMIDAKDMPGEGPAEGAPQSPGEGPPPTLPQPPPFTFLPVLIPSSP
ncbi:MAG TPA: hypothetical protein VK993_07065 [Chthoniobacterales bacterium]|nr:hypothetical protein [Chthoniobacterales bacterium]